MDSDLLITLTIIGCSWWVYFDASSHQIGSYRDELNRVRGWSSISWGIGSLILFVIFFPLYLIRRKTLLKIAEKHPAKSDKSLGILVIAMISVFLLWYFHFR
ncbi:TPA: hypothetical protein ACS8CD_003667 [Providencia alcalifaciens]